VFRFFAAYFDATPHVAIPMLGAHSESQVPRRAAPFGNRRGLSISLMRGLMEAEETSHWPPTSAHSSLRFPLQAMAGLLALAFLHLDSTLLQEPE